MKFTSAGCWGHSPVQVGVFGCLGTRPAYRQHSWWSWGEGSSSPCPPFARTLPSSSASCPWPCWSCAPTAAALLGPGQAPPRPRPRGLTQPCLRGIPARGDPANPARQPTPGQGSSALLSCPRLLSHLLFPSHLLHWLLPGRAPGPDWPFPEPAPAKS